jgi:hypothetical protein
MKAPSDESESWPRMGLSPTEIWLVWFQMMVYFGGMCVCVSSPENAMVISSLAKTSSCLLAVVLKCAGSNCSDLRLATQHKNIHPMPICWPLSSFLVSHHPLQFRKALVKMRKVWRRGRKEPENGVFRWVPIFWRHRHRLQHLHDFTINELKCIRSSHTFKVLLARKTFWGVTSKAPNQAGTHAANSQPSCLDLIGEQAPNSLYILQLVLNLEYLGSLALWLGNINQRTWQQASSLNNTPHTRWFSQLVENPDLK